MIAEKSRPGSALNSRPRVIRLGQDNTSDLPPGEAVPAKSMEPGVGVML